MAERALGELLEQMPKNEGITLNGRDAFGTAQTVGPKADAPPTLAEMGISYKQSSRAQKLGDSAIIPVTHTQRVLCHARHAL